MNASSSSSSVTLTKDDEGSPKPKVLSSSLTLRSPSKRASSEAARAYKQASELYLTRQLPDALSVLDPYINPVSDENGQISDSEDSLPEAPITKAKTAHRIKFWALYISLLNSILDLGYDEGKGLFGKAKYKEIVALVCNGDIWERVVRDGYRGREGSVDAEVVYNLATLLLKQARSQTVNQARLESYLSSSPNANLVHNSDPDPATGNWRQPDGAKTPGDLEARWRILELFTLHVLPKNEEWDYAKSCISMSDVLDDERRETFLQTLQELKEMQDIEQQQEEEQQKVVKMRKGTEDQRPEQLHTTTSDMHSPRQSDSIRRRKDGETDHGIEKRPPNSYAEDQSRPETSHTVSDTYSASPAARPHSQAPTESSKNRKVRKATQRPPPSYLHQVIDLCRRLQTVVGSTLVVNPSVILKMLICVVAIIVAYRRRDVRERSRQIVRDGWDKVRRTLGMGVKVSYI